MDEETLKQVVSMMADLNLRAIEITNALMERKIQPDERTILALVLVVRETMHRNISKEEAMEIIESLWASQDELQKELGQSPIMRALDKMEAYVAEQENSTNH